MNEHDDLIRKFTSIRASTLGYLRVIVRDPHLAEDLFQETSIIVLKKLTDFDRSHDFSAWVRGIALNLARNALRKEQYLHLMPSPELAAAIERTHEASSSREIAEMSGRLEHLNRCLAQVESRQRKLLELRYRQGASLQMIAEELGRTPGAIQVALSRVRQFLFKCMEQRKGLLSHG